MRKQNLRNWELRLGLSHVVVLLGIATGCIACAFYLGFFAGRGAGFERVMAGDTQHLARLPIDQKVNIADAQEALVNEVYAKLGEVGMAIAESEGIVGQKNDQKTAAAAEDKRFAIPEVLEPSEDEDLPLEKLRENLKAELPEQQQKTERVAVRVLGGDELAEPVLRRSSDEKPTTLGALRGVIDDRTAADAAKARAEEERKVEQQQLASVDNRRRLSPDSDGGSKARSPETDVIKGRFGDDQTAKVFSNTSSGFLKEMVPSGWFAQIAAPSRLDDADTLAQRLRSSGFPVLIQRANVKGQEYFRVLVGPEQSREQADRLVGQLRRESYVRTEPFIKQVQ